MNKRINLADIHSVAIIQTAFLGDVALTLPMAELIKHYSPGIYLNFVTTQQAAPIANCLKCIDEIIVFDKRGVHKGIGGIRLIASELKKRNVDCVISPHRSLRSTLVAYFSGAKIRIGFSQNAMSFIYNYRIKYLFHEHEIVRNFQLLTPFIKLNGEINNSLINPDHRIPNINIFKDNNNLNLNLNFESSDIEYVRSILNELSIFEGDRVVLIAPGSIWGTKRWLPEYYIRLAELLINTRYNCIIIGSSEDSELCMEIAESSGTISLAGKLSIPQTIFLMKQAKLTITNDSAPTHFAGIVNCPVITIYGPTSPRFGFSPWSTPSKVIENNDLSCKPCAIHGSSKCPLGTHECMVSIKPEQVYLEAINILEKEYSKEQ